MEVARAMTAVPVKNDDHYVWISKQGVVFFEIFFCEIRHFFNVMNIVSQLKYKGIPIIVPFCMTKSVLFIYIIKYVLIYSIVFSIVAVKCYTTDSIYIDD